MQQNFENRVQENLKLLRGKRTRRDVFLTKTFVRNDYSCLLPLFFFLLLFLLLLSLSLSRRERKKGGGGGEKIPEKGKMALFIIDLQTCQRQSCPLWDKAKKAATLFLFPFVFSLWGESRGELRALLTFFGNTTTEIEAVCFAVVRKHWNKIKKASILVSAKVFSFA